MSMVFRIISKSRGPGFNQSEKVFDMPDHIFLEIQFRKPNRTHEVVELGEEGFFSKLAQSLKILKEGTLFM